MRLIQFSYQKHSNMSTVILNSQVNDEKVKHSYIRLTVRGYRGTPAHIHAHAQKEKEKEREMCTYVCVSVYTMRMSERAKEIRIFSVSFTFSYLIIAIQCFNISDQYRRQHHSYTLWPFAGLYYFETKSRIPLTFNHISV